MKSILFYFNSLRPSGGIERVIVTLAEKLVSDYQITILVKDEPISFYQLDKNVNLHSLNNTTKFNMNSQLSRFFTALNAVYYNSRLLKQYLNKNNFDYFYLAHPLNVLEFHFARGLNKEDTIISEHGAPNAYNVIYKIVKKLLYPLAKIYVVPTTKDTMFYKKLGYPAEYLPHFRSSLPYCKAALSSNIALSIGRFTSVKQQLVLLQVWNDLVHQYKILDWRLFLVGNGELKQQLEQYIKRNALENCVLLMPSRQDVEVYYKSASMFLLSSKSEGFGMVLLEAISFGLPCISFDCPSGPRDIIKDNNNGYLITPNDVTAFKQSVLKLILNPRLRNEMGEKSFEISKDWNDDKLRQAWKSILI